MSFHVLGVRHVRLGMREQKPSRPAIESDVWKDLERSCIRNEFSDANEAIADLLNHIEHTDTGSETDTDNRSK